MHYIVLDLEWNQPTSYQGAAYRSSGEKLLFEVIQFGAAKLDENLQIVDNTSVLVRPSYYLTIHPRIKKMTGLSQDVLCDADEFPQAITRFLAWCGEDCVFITWGGDDVSVLKQNMECFESPYLLPKMYDLQQLFALESGKHGQMALKGAMELLNLQQEQERPFHNAMHDAYYTALVFQKILHPEDIFRFEEIPKKLVHNECRKKLRITDTVDSVGETIASEKVQSPKCPNCGKPTKLQTEMILQSPGRYVALSKCQQHGVLFMKLHFVALPDGKKGMKMSILPSNQQTRAYVHTKELQYQYKKKHGDFSGMDIQDLAESMSANMPFEDA